jgi:hypothetical protein
MSEFANYKKAKAVSATVTCVRLNSGIDVMVGAPDKESLCDALGELFPGWSYSSDRFQSTTITARKEAIK